MTVRGCAQQDYSYQVYHEAEGWRTVTEIKDGVYPEGCFLSAAANSHRLRRHKTEYCYCKEDLCNGSQLIRGDLWPFLVAFGLVKLLT